MAKRKSNPEPPVGEPFVLDAGLGQVFTADQVADEMCALAAIDVTRISAGCRVLDPSCGDGRLLLAVVRKIMAQLPPSEWTAAFEGVHGWDIDPRAIDACRNNLTTATGYSNWNLRCCDALIEDVARRAYGWCLANPPYIRIHNMSSEQRALLRARFATCREGMVDMYIAFIEKIEVLAEKAVIICPSSVRTSQASRKLREHLVKKMRVSDVHDHGHHQRFPDASVNTAYVIIGDNSNEVLTVVAPDATKYLSPVRNLVRGEPWVSAAAATSEDVRLRDVCDISVGIATLADKVYVLRPVNETDGELIAVHSPLGIRCVERDILKPIIKASIAGEGQNLFILCPYSVGPAGKHEIIPEDVLAVSFPNAYRYLCDMRERLDKRDKGKANPVTWYAFGRTQGLNTVLREKIVFSPMADSGRPHFCTAPPGTYYYSGYGAFPKPPATLADIAMVLTSDKFRTHLEVHARKMSGTWTSCSKSEIQDMPVQDIIDASRRD